MTTSQELLTKISQKTIEIKEHYPELQKYLDETRITLPHGNNSTAKVDTESLQNYLNSLNEMVAKYKFNS